MLRRKFSAAALVLPDGSWVMQRRKPDADLGAGKLGFWGGKKEPMDKTPEETLLRELGEETSLVLAELKPEFVKTYPLDPPLSARDSMAFSFYRIPILNAGFGVKEGATAEVYKPEDLKLREDIMPTVRYILNLASN